MSTTPRLEQHFNDRSIDHHVVPDFGDSAFNLLRMRMEALELEANEVRRIEPGVFSDLVEACTDCESKPSCEQDFECASAGTAPDWEKYCPNADTLKAVVDLPWFRKAEE